METGAINVPEGYQLDKPGLPEGYTLDDGPSILGAAGRGALDAVPFGTKGAAAIEAGLGSGTYDSYLKELDSLLATDKEKQPVAHYTGEVAGSVAPFLIPGVGEALGAESLAGRAGIGAGLGALQAASNTRKPLTSKEGLADVALGAGSGAVFNPAIGAVGDAITSKLGSLAPKLEGIANSKAVQSGNLDPGTLGLSEDELQNLGQNMRDLDLVNGPTLDRYEKSKDLLGQVGMQIQETGAASRPLKDASPYIQNLLAKAAEYSKIDAPEFQAAAKTYKAGANAIQGLGRPTGVINGSDIPEHTMQESVHDALTSYTQPGEGAAPNLSQKPLSWEDLGALKKSFGKMAFFSDGNVKNPAAADVYGQLREAMKDIVKSSPEEYQGLMHTYGTLKDITEGLQTQLQREQATGTQTKGFGMAGKLGGMILGGNVPATVGLSAALAPVHPFMAAGVASTLATNAPLMSKAAGSAANALTGLSANGLGAPATNTIENMLTHPAMAAYKPMFQQATAGLKDPAEVQKKQTITDFVLSQRDPNYSAAKEKAAEGF